MKKITFLLVLAGMFHTSVSVAQDAARGIRNQGWVNHNEPIVFMERGIEFYVFADGSFDFNTRPTDTNGTFYFRGAGRRGQQLIVPNYGVRIDTDSFGRIRRVGNVFVNYDGLDRVNRIGTILMQYNRFGLARVGGLELIYNRRGQLVQLVGSVYHRNHGFSSTYYGPSHGVAYQNQGGYYFKQSDQD